MEPLVIIGNGMAGVACLENILSHKHRFDITIFGDETQSNYNRPLCDGIVTGAAAPSLDCDSVVGHAVVCPLHGWKIDLQTGEVLKPDVSVRVETYDVRVNEGIVEVAIPAASLGCKAAR